MKSQITTQSRANLSKKPVTKPLNEKKNSVIVEPVLKKQRSKPNLTITHHESHQTNMSNFHKMASPKNVINSHSSSTIMVMKTEVNEELSKHLRVQTTKKAIGLNKVRKTGQSKYQPIKKQFLSNLRSPKGLKPTAVQSQIFLSQKQSQGQHQYELNIELDTSIIRTEHLDDSIIEHHEEEILRIPYEKQHCNIISREEIEELTKCRKQQGEEIQRLKRVNEELERKLNKLKLAQHEHKKKLRERISTFNQEGDQIKHLKDRIHMLEKELQHSLQENKMLIKSAQNINTNQDNSSTTVQQMGQQHIAININQNINATGGSLKLFSVLSLDIVPDRLSISNDKKKNVMIDESVMTSFEDSICDGVLSFINGNSSGNLQQSIGSNDKAKEIELQSSSIIPSLELETIRISYEEKYQQLIGNLEQRYKQSTRDIQQRMALFISQSTQIIKDQQKELFTLQTKIDQLYQKLQQCECSSMSKRKSPCVGIEEEELRHMMEVNGFRKRLSQKDDQLRGCRQEIHIREIECKRIAAELDMERIRHSLNSETTSIKKQLQQYRGNQNIQLMKQELRHQKQKSAKLLSQNQKKEQLIRRLSSLHATRKVKK